jgi:hypothetical protein
MKNSKIHKTSIADSIMQKKDSVNSKTDHVIFVRGAKRQKDKE